MHHGGTTETRFGTTEAFGGSHVLHETIKEKGFIGNILIKVNLLSIRLSY